MEKSTNNIVSLYVIGTELTRGIISDKHIPLLTSELTHLGFSIKRAVIVPDDGTIGKSLALGVSDSDYIIVTGGLGPTSDDMTRNIIASLCSVKLEKNQEAWDMLYQRVGQRIYGANEQQTMLPQGFEMISNPNGTACGFMGYYTNDSRKVFIAAMPGPPREMQPMFYNFLKPHLSDLIGYVEQERDEYSVYLIGESLLEELCQKCAFDDISWGTRFQQYKTSLYITGSTKENRDLFISKLRSLVGEGLIVDGDDVDACDLLTDLLKENNYTISCAESCTSGLIAKLLTDKSGSSKWFFGGCATYDNKAKEKILNVKNETLQKYGAVSSQCALEMARGMLSLLETDYALSITGFAGPDGGTEDNPVGTIYLGFASKHRKEEVVKLKLTLFSRESSRRRFAICAFILARFYILGANIIDICKTWQYI